MENLQSKERECFAKVVSDYFRRCLLGEVDTRPPVRGLIQKTFNEVVVHYPKIDYSSLNKSATRWMHNIALWPDRRGGFSPVGYSKWAGPRDPVNRGILEYLSNWKNMETFFAVSAWDSDKIPSGSDPDPDGISDEHIKAARRLLLSKLSTVRKRMRFDEISVAGIYSAVLGAEAKRKRYSLSGISAGAPKGPNKRKYKGRSRKTDIPKDPGGISAKGITKADIGLKKK